MAKISKVEPIVLETLINNPRSREDDYILIGEVLKHFVNIDSSMSYLCNNHIELGIPSIGTITRCRRKLQASNPQLKCGKVEKIRKEEEQLYFEYSLDK